MSKVLDWNKVRQPLGFDDKRRKAWGQLTYKEYIQQSREKQEQFAKAQELRKAQEPILKSLLLDHLVNRKALRVMKSIQNPTEGLSGVNDETQDELDNFYYNGAAGNRDSSLSTVNASFVEQMEVIPAGTELIFKSLDKTLGQMIFKSVSGKEYAIYNKEQIMFNGQLIENPGFFGLLYNTHLVEKL